MLNRLELPTVARPSPLVSRVAPDSASVVTRRDHPGADAARLTEFVYAARLTGFVYAARLTEFAYVDRSLASRISRSLASPRRKSPATEAVERPHPRLIAVAGREDA